jgi:ferredoxin/flavodoxin
MQRAIIYVFSGTKNTLLTANMARDSFERANVHTTIFEIQRPFENVPLPQDFDFVGFAYPVHAFNSPQFFLKFVKTLPNANKKAFIIKTSGEPFHLNDASSQKLYKMLTSKGYDVALDKHLLMPYNIVFRYQDELAKQMYIYNQKLCELFVADFLDGKHAAFHFKLRHTITSAVFRIQWIGAIINGKIYRINKRKCNSCMLCLKSCPTKNISLRKDKLRFDSACAMCMRCVMFCPVNAINPGILRFWKVNGAYNFERLMKDNSIKGDFINEDTKGYFRLFKKYYRNADAQIYGTGDDSDEQNESEDIKQHT